MFRISNAKFCLLHLFLILWYSFYLFYLQTDEEMDEQERVIQELERALNAKINPLKLAETRLENR